MRSIQSLIRPNILNLKPYSSARSEFKGKAEVFLDANENPFDNRGLNRYPDPLQWELKSHVSKLKNVEKEHVFLGNGSDEAIDLLIRIFCEPAQDAILTLPPTYGMYRVSADIANVAIDEVSLTKEFQPDVDKILSFAKPKHKILFLCSPNNPTGNLFDEGKIIELIEKFDGIVVIDEAYIDFSTQPSFSNLITKYSNLVVLQTFSKAWGLAGMRLGMAFTNTEIMKYFNAVKAPYNLNNLTQKTAIEILKTEVDKQKKQVSILLSERQRIAKALNDATVVKKVYPSDANFILFETDDANQMYQDFIENAIVLRNRNNVHLCEGCIRVTIGTPDENTRFIEFLNQ